MKESFYLKTITVLSILIPVAVAAIFWMPDKSQTIDPRLSVLPLFHAILNGINFLLLLLGFFFVMKKKFLEHKACMISAAALSSVFLISYVIYHYVAPQAKYGGEGMMRTIYFPILISHILLATIIVPMVLMTLYRGLSGHFEKHKKIARWTLPIWLYVAFTGVIVYLMMRPYYPI